MARSTAQEAAGQTAAPKAAAAPGRGSVAAMAALAGMDEPEAGTVAQAAPRSPAAQRQRATGTKGGAKVKAATRKRKPAAKAKPSPRAAKPTAAPTPAAVQELAAVVAAERGTILDGKRHAGRPTVLTEAVAETICQAVELGMPFVWAARYAGVSDSVVSVWRQRGDADVASGEVTVYARLVDAVKRAESAAIGRGLAGIREGGRDWTRWAWLLERRWPEHFGRRDATEVGFRGEVKIVIEHVKDWHARDVIDIEPEDGPGQRPGRRDRAAG